MTTPGLGQSAMWFEDFEIGQRIVTQARTVTPVDTTAWCMFTGDMHPFHVDDEMAARAGFVGRRFPPGLMSVAIASGLWERLGLLQGTGLYIVEQTVRYRRPIAHGDTIHLELVVVGLEPCPADDRGTVQTSYAIVTGDGRRCVEGEFSFAVASRPSEAVASYGVFAT